jgi:hypothetical protein
MRPSGSNTRSLFLPAAFFLLALSACTFKGTTEAITDPTTDILSSTVRTWFTEEGYVKEEYKVIAFTSLNFTNLKQDMARGRGEYLASLETLMDVPPDRRAEFETLIQDQYPRLVASNRTTPDEMLASLAQVMVSHPTLQMTVIRN